MSQHASLRTRDATLAGRLNGATRTMKTYGQTTLLHVALASLTIALILVLTICARDAQANPLAHKRAPNAGDGKSAGGMLQQSSGDYNNLDSLISDFLDDRLKKSKQNSVRQIKQTLRFGRRSDPLMMPISEMERERDVDLLDHFGGRPASFANED